MQRKHVLSLDDGGEHTRAGLAALTCAYGEVRLRTLALGGLGAGDARVVIGSRQVQAAVRPAGGGVTISFPAAIALGRDDRLEAALDGRA